MRLVRCHRYRRYVRRYQTAIRRDGPADVRRTVLIKPPPTSSPLTIGGGEVGSESAPHGSGRCVFISDPRGVGSGLQMIGLIR